MALILNKTLPPLSVGGEVVAHPDGEVLVIDAPAAPSPTGTREGVFKRRSIRLDGKPECIPHAPHEMFSDDFSLQRLDYADAFKRAGLAERTGRGVSRMYSALLRVGRDGPDFSKSSDRLVCVELPTTQADLAMTRFILGWEQERSRSLSLLEVRGVGGSRRYRLQPAYFGATGSAAAYVRVRGTELLQQEQMVTEYLRAFGSVTRAKTAELCLIAPAG